MTARNAATLAGLILLSGCGRADFSGIEPDAPPRASAMELRGESFHAPTSVDTSSPGLENSNAPEHRDRAENPKIETLPKITVAEPVPSSSAPPPARTVPTTAPPTKNAITVTWSQLGGFSYELVPGETTDSEVLAKIPPGVRALDGRMIEIEGFMMPMQVSASGRVTGFILVASQLLCCYGVPPELNEWIDVKASGDGVPAHTDVPIRVRGRLRIGEKIIDGVMVGLYRMTAESIEEIE